MTINFIEILLATIAQFIVGAVWYMPLFGKIWGKIHCFDQLDKKTQQAMQAEMGPYYALQLVVTVMTSTILSVLIATIPSYSPYALTLLLWIGFVVPTQASAVVFGGTQSRWITTKIAIMAGGSLVCLLVAATIMNLI